MIGAALCLTWALHLIAPAPQAADEDETSAVTPTTADADLDAAADPAASFADTDDMPDQGGDPPFDPTATLMQRAAGALDRTNLGGFGEHAWISGSDEVARFLSLRYGIFLAAQLTERISATTELLLVWGGTPVKIAGLWQGGHVGLAISAVDVRIWRAWAVRAGILLIPVGTVNLRHDGPAQELTDLPIAYTSIVPTVWSEVGAGVAGEVAAGPSQRIRLEVYAVNGLDARIADGSGFATARGSLFEDNNRDKALVGRLAWLGAGGSEVGLSGYTGAYDPVGRRLNLANVDVAVRSGAWDVVGEAVLAVMDSGYVQGFASESAANTSRSIPTNMWGFYVEAHYRFTVPVLWQHLPADLQNTHVTAVLRYEGKDTDMAQNSAAGDQRRLTLGLNVRPSPSYVFKTNLQLESYGADGSRGAYEFFDAGFWRHNIVRFAASVAYLF